jgi:PleD family two-component response regulator
MTASVGLGVHTLPRARVAPDDLVSAAERALHQAKTAGKDQFAMVPATVSPKPADSRLV